METQPMARQTAEPRIAPWHSPQGLRDARLTAVLPEESCDTLRFEGQRMAMDGCLDATLATVLDCRLGQLSLGTALLDHAHVTGTEIDACGMVRLSSVGMTMDGTRWSACRLGSWDAMDSTLRSTVIEDCRIGALNLRSARWRDVAFRRCRIDSFDAADASLTRVAFPDTSIGTLSLRHAQLTDVDLRGASLEAIEGVEYLAGTTMTLDQIADLAAAFAAGIGIRTA